MNKNIGALLFLLGLILWPVTHFFPSFLGACIFWAAIIVGGFITSNYYYLPGACCNAAAVIANGGFMPVFDMEASGGIHIQGTSDSALPFLCDRYWGASVGDFLLLAGLIWFILRRHVLNRTPARADQ